MGGNGHDSTASECQSGATQTNRNRADNQTGCTGDFD